MEHDCNLQHFFIFPGNVIKSIPPIPSIPPIRASKGLTADFVIMQTITVPIITKSNPSIFHLDFNSNQRSILSRLGLLYGDQLHSGHTALHAWKACNAPKPPSISQVGDRPWPLTLDPHRAFLPLPPSPPSILHKSPPKKPVRNR